MEAQNFSEDTVNTRRACIGYFLDWCRERGLDDVKEITRPMLERYQRSLYQYRKKNGEPLTFRTQNSRLRAVKGWFRWLARQNYLLHNPASELILPRLENRLPKYILNAEEAEQVLQQAGHHDAGGLARSRCAGDVLRDRQCGAWRSRISSSTTSTRERGTVMIRQGKGKKDRHHPDRRAGAGVDRQIYPRGPVRAAGRRAEDGTVFLTDMGEPLRAQQLTTLVRALRARNRRSARWAAATCSATRWRR